MREFPAAGTIAFYLWNVFFVQVGGVNRRMVGHGNLAERSVLSVMPGTEAFPYTTRVSAEVRVFVFLEAMAGRRNVENRDPARLESNAISFRRMDPGCCRGVGNR